jgi:hypothetical protein
VVLVGGGEAEPRVLHRGRVELADGVLAGSKQPYHWAEGRPLRDAERELARFRKVAGAMAYDGIRSLVENAVREGHEVKTAGILQSSGRKGSSLEAILGSHALIHTADGDHFRDALAEGCDRCGVEVVRVPQRDLEGLAAKTIGHTEEELAIRVRDLGRAVGSPWAKDQKSACLLGWYLLASG